MTRKSVSLVLVLCMLAALLCGCGATQPDTSNTTTAPAAETPAATTEAPAATAEAAAEPVAETKACEELVIAIGKDVGDLNPHQYNGQMPAQDWVYDGLTEMVNGKVSPSLAESWDISEDGLTYTFHLRDAKFSDGSPLTAELVIKNFQTVINHSDRHSFIQTLFVIDSMEAPDEHTFVIKLTQPCNSLLDDLSFIRPLAIVAESCIPENGDTFDGLLEQIGTGPWVLSEYVESQYSVFTRNEYYWGEAPKFERLKVVVISDPDTVANSLRAGEIDMFVDTSNAMSIDTFQALAAEGFTTEVNDETSVTSISLNTAGEVTGDLAVRQAIEYATDNSVVSEYVFAGLQKSATCYFATSVRYVETASYDTYSYDPDKAAAILDEAGWVLNTSTGYREKDGKVCEFDLLYDTAVKTGKDTATILQDQYAKVGIKMNICEEDSKVFRTKWKSGEFGGILYDSWGGSYEPFSTLAAMRTDGDKFSTVQLGMSNKAELNAVMDDALSQSDAAKLQEDFNYILQAFYDEAVYVPIVVTCKKAVYNSELTNLNLDEGYYGIPVTEVCYK